jgi:hypothetical protein
MRSRRIYGDAQEACLAAFVEFMFKKKGMAFLYGKKPFLLTGQNDLRSRYIIIQQAT